MDRKIEWGFAAPARRGRRRAGDGAQRRPARRSALVAVFFFRGLDIHARPDGREGCRKLVD
jgi:hypothetical protein